MIRIVVVLLVSLTVYSCTESNNNTDDLASIETGLFQKDMLFQDSLRSYFVYVPESVKSLESIPLLFTFHGYGSNAERIMNYSGYNKLADSLGFISVYPQGTLLEGRTHWNVGGWTLESPVDDVAFVDSLINQLLDTYPIEEERIYANGMSEWWVYELLACLPVG